MDTSNSEQPEQQQAKIILALKEVILAVTGSFDLDTLLQRIVESCVNFSNSSRGSLFLYDEESEKLVMRAEKNNAPRLRFNASYDVNAGSKEKIGLTAFVFRTGEALALNTHEEILNHPSHLGKYNKDSNGEIDCQSLICVPLKNPDKKTIGILKIENTLDRETSHVFSDRDVQDFQLLADIASEAIINFKNQAVKINSSINKILSNSLESSKPGKLNERLRKIAATFKEISNAVGVSVWLREGSRLVCKAAVGHNYEDLEQQSYDLSTDVSKVRSIGLTPWIAKSGETINIKTHQEIISHPQYKGTYDNVLYPDGSERCESFIGAPLKTGNRIIGVIKADTRVADRDHPEGYFTTEEAQIFSYLSIITSIIVESEQEFERSNSHNRQLVALYKLGTECYALESSEAILWYLLIGLTHAEGIGYNRANLFNFTNEKNKLYLSGLVGLGPKNREEGKSIQKRFDSGDILNLDDCKSVFFKNNSPPLSDLQMFIDQSRIPLSRQCVLFHFINESLKHKRSNIGLISIDKCCEDIKNLLTELETNSNDFLAFCLFDVEDQIFVGICENVYSEQSLNDEYSIKAANTFVFQISLALSRLSLKKSKEETTEEAWREFTAITAHRIGTETSIMSEALDCLKQFSISNRQGLTDYFNDLQNSLDSLKSAVREYTELQKPPEIQFQKLNVSHILDSVFQMIERLQSSPHYVNRIEIINNYANDLPMIHGDYDSLLYVFKELYDNAIKSMPNGGKLNVYSSIVDCGKYLQVRISDTGTGINSENIPKIFNRGFKDRTGGTGLGLYIVKRNIELHGGTVVAENNSNAGASFLVNLPIRKSDLNRILIVEDNDIHLKYLLRSIREKYPSLEIDTAKNEGDATELLIDSLSEDNRSAYDFVIADIKLDDGGGSELGGIHLLEYIKTNNSKVKVIIITANKGAIYREPSGRKIGVFDKAKEFGAIACLSRNQSRNYLEELNEILGSS